MIVGKIAGGEFVEGASSGVLETVGKIAGGETLVLKPAKAMTSNEVGA